MAYTPQQYRYRPWQQQQLQADPRLAQADAQTQQQLAQMAQAAQQQGGGDMLGQVLGAFGGQLSGLLGDTGGIKAVDNIQATPVDDATLQGATAGFPSLDQIVAGMDAPQNPRLGLLSQPYEKKPRGILDFLGGVFR